MSDAESSDTINVGLSSFDFEGLSALERTVVRVLLRQREATLDQLLPLIQAYDPTWTPTLITTSFHDLVARTRILSLATDPVSYKVNMRRKQTGTLRPSMWEAVSDDATPEYHAQRAKHELHRQRTRHLLDTLDELPRRATPDFSDQIKPDRDESDKQ